jgi:hypothetical protein
MKTHPPLEQPPNIDENPQPLALANFILWKFLQMPGGGLYAKWDTAAGKAIWFYSHERDYMFREPHCDSVLYEEHDRGRFRSLVFRFGSLGDDGLCGHCEFQISGLKPKRYAVHSSFYPEMGIGLWIAITSPDDSDDGAKGRQPAISETNRTSPAGGSRG